MRILNVGDFNWMTGRETHTANVDLFPIRSKLTNAAIRAGHFVAEYSDRAVARRAGPWPWRSAGPRAARRGFLQMVDEVRPDLILLQFADHIDAQTLEAARRLAPGVAIVDINIDPLPDPKTIARLDRRAGVVDALFVTTAGPGLKRFASDRGFVAFMPNPVDRAVETARAFDAETVAADLILPLGDDSPRQLGGERRAPSQIVDDLRTRLPRPSPRNTWLGIAPSAGPALFRGAARRTHGLGAVSLRGPSPGMHRIAWRTCWAAVFSP